jgi:dienelactone hydrolase
MAEVLLFHHVQGQTAGFHAFADEVRSVGHTVHTPDLFDGRTFGSIDEGLAHAREVGFGEIIEHGVHAANALPNELVYAGFSLGVVPAQKLAQTRPGARGALLFYSCVSTSEFGTSWPADVPVQIHGMAADPIFVDEGDIDAARELVESAEDAELFSTPATSTTSPTAACRATTRALPRSSRSGCLRSSSGSDAPPKKELEVR